MARYRASDPIRLKRGFDRAGILRGRHRTDVIEAVGRPRRVSAAPFDSTLLTWSAGRRGRSYEVALMFDVGGLCVGVAHEVGPSAKLKDR
ncbi:hypothetical protein [Sphingomonas sp. BK580]|uniref:hypothetical protein n=1 Tax=Sphingomonas sp. BK580 TaxID=2586972 RepID=UPI00160A6E3F|nr:hypothetical protein [Sphingomonas sp. BK580]MBB3693615.1 hypothetical protein [Sphingomonas sp. BK580]